MNSEVYVWGRGGDFQLGIARPAEREWRPLRLASLSHTRVLDMNTGARHVLVATNRGVFSFGWGDDGALGHGSTHDLSTPQLIKSFALVRMLDLDDVVQVAAGDHSVALTRSGAVYVFGNGKLVPRLVVPLRAVRVTAVSAGSEHVLALEASGRLYTWGASFHGHGHTAIVDKPQVVRGLRDEVVTHISAGHSHSLVVVERGEVFAFGAGSNYVLGLGDEDDRLAPARVTALSGMQIRRVFAGFCHSAVVSSLGELLTFGFGIHGQLGHGVQLSERLPRTVRALAGERIVLAACGGFHTLALSAGGKVFAFGLAEFGQLGLPKYEVEQARRRATRPARAATGGPEASTAGSSAFQAALPPIAASDDEAEDGDDEEEEAEAVEDQADDGSSSPRTPPPESHLLPKTPVTTPQKKEAPPSSGGSRVKRGGTTSLLTMALAEDSTGDIAPMPAAAARRRGGTDGAVSDCTSTGSTVLDVHGAPSAYSVAPTQVPPELCESTPVVITDLLQLGNPAVATARVTDIHAGFWHSTATVTYEPVGSPKCEDPNALQATDDDDGETPSTLVGSFVPALAASYADMWKDEHLRSVAASMKRYSSTLNEDRLAKMVPRTAQLLSEEAQRPAPPPQPAEEEVPDIDRQTSYESVLSEDGEAGSDMDSAAAAAAAAVTTTSGDEDGGRGAGLWQRLLASFTFGNVNSKLLREAKSEAERLRQWEVHVLPNWEQLRGSAALERLWRRGGIPPTLRGRVWRLSIEGTLPHGVTRELYDELSQRVLTTPTSQATHDQVTRLIQVDLPRTMPHLGVFKHGHMHEQLAHLLEVYALFDDAIGYAQGMSYVAAMILLHTADDFDAFALFAFIVQKRLMSALYSMNVGGMLQHMQVFDLLFECNAPRLFAHFREHNVSVHYYLLDWWMTMFTRAVPFQLTSLIFDRFFLDGDLALHQAAVGTLLCFSSQLRRVDFEGVVLNLKRLPREADASARLLYAIDRVTVPPQLAELNAQLNTQPLQVVDDGRGALGREAMAAFS